MSDTKISGLTAATAAAAANEFAINETGTSKKVTGAQVKAFVLDGPVMTTLPVCADEAAAAALATGTIYQTAQGAVRIKL